MNFDITAVNCQKLLRPKTNTNKACNLVLGSFDVSIDLAGFNRKRVGFDTACSCSNGKATFTLDGQIVCGNAVYGGFFAHADLVLANKVESQIING